MKRPSASKPFRRSGTAGENLRLSPEAVKAQLRRLKLSEHLRNNEVLHARRFVSLSGSWSFEALHSWLQNTCNFLSTVVYSRHANLPRATRAYTAASAFKAVTKGHSLQINDLNRVLGPSDPLMIIFFALQEYLGFRLEELKMIYTPPSQRGLPFHSDEVDILTVQLLGSKHWDVWPDRDLKDCAQVPPQLSVDLHPGSILFVPALTPHAVVAGSQESLSVAFRLHPRRYLELLDELYRLPDLYDITNRIVPLRREIPAVREHLDKLSSALAEVSDEDLLSAITAAKRAFV